MVQLTLQSHEHCHVELPCNDTLGELSVLGEGGKCSVAVQASTDGMTWASPVAHRRLENEQITVKLRLPEHTRKLRVIVENTSSKAAHVQVEDPSAAPVETEDAAL